MKEQESVDEKSGRTPTEEARDGLLLMISIQERNGFLAPEIAVQARAFVKTLADGISDNERLREALRQAEAKLYRCSVGHGVADHRNYPCDLPGEARLIMLEALRASPA